MAKSNAVSVKLDRRTYELINRYASLKNMTIEKVMDEGLWWWLDSFVEAEMECTIERMSSGQEGRA